MTDEIKVGQETLNPGSLEQTENPTVPGQGTQQSTELDEQAKKKHTTNLWNNAKEQVRKEILREFKKELSEQGLDPENWKTDLSMLREIAGAAQEQPGESVKNTVKAWKQKVEELNKQKAEAEKGKLAAERNYLIDHSILQTAVNNGFSPYDMKSMVRDFKDQFDFEIGENGMTVKDKGSEIPVYDSNGAPMKIDAVFKKWAQSGNLWRFKANSPGGAGMNIGTGGIGLTPEVMRLKEISDKMRAGQKLVTEEIDFFNANKDKVKYLM